MTILLIKQSWLNWMAESPYRFWVAFVFFFNRDEPYPTGKYVNCRRMPHVWLWQFDVLQIQAVCRDFRIAFRNVVRDMMFLENSDNWKAFWRGTWKSYQGNVVGADTGYPKPFRRYWDPVKMNSYNRGYFVHKKLLIRLLSYQRNCVASYKDPLWARKLIMHPQITDDDERDAVSDKAQKASDTSSQSTNFEWFRSLWDSSYRTPSEDVISP